MDPFPDHGAVTRELVRGHELVSQLKAVLRELVTGGGCEPVDALVEEISGTFTRALAVLSTRSEARVVHSDPETFAVSSQNTRQEGGGGKMVKVSEARCWNAGIRRRSYFKCAQKKYQGCQAIKHVQRMQDDPPMFLVTYIGQHTCSNVLQTSQWIPDDSPSSDKCMLSFELDQSSIHQVNYWSSPEVLSKHPAFWEPSQATSSKKSTMETSYDAPSVPAAADLPECSPFPMDRSGCSNVVPGMFSQPSPQATDVDSFMSLLESFAGLCSDKDVGYK
ncbi:probable WRKY transcription factor 54 isoform X2 [Elaeis guineensis]|uniref:probable WRKY transcription factor 54 isoform X2 n=1 Tax=Elaeis guineensis var. tenera TaxID=51953 RepID=UPI003C6D0336